MTIELFIYLFTIGSAISSLVTQATKKAVPNIPSNVVALINAVFVGLLGTVIAFNFLNQFSINLYFCLLNDPNVLRIL